ncbi:MAG: hypothetical protein WKG01_10440 [Kofleriaceae bacterium]
MGPERVLQAARAVALLALVASAGAARADDKLRTRERIGVIDLGPTDTGSVRKQLAEAVVTAGFEVVNGDGLEDALAGADVDKDAVQLASALAEAQRAFGALDCKATLVAADQAIGIAAARQAAGIAVPELPRAWTLALLCSDRSGDLDRAQLAATRLRALGGSPDVPAAVWKKYPDVDTVIDRELVALEIVATNAPGATVWIDFEPRGPAPLHVLLPDGDHVIAVASKTRRGWAAGTAVKTQKQLAVPTIDQRGPASEIARRVARWNGKVPAPAEIGWAMSQVRARVVLVRRGDRVEAWGRIGLSEAPRQLGGDDGVAKASDPADVKRVLALVTDRVQGWNDRAPDPDQPLLLEDPKDRRFAIQDRDGPTKWWVYAAIIGAVAGAATLVLVQDTGSTVQRVELHYP